MYDYDSNAIFDIPIKNLQAKLYLLHGKHFTIASANMVTQQNIFILDNEISTELKAVLKKYKFTFELTAWKNRRKE